MYNIEQFNTMVNSIADKLMTPTGKVIALLPSLGLKMFLEVVMFFIMAVVCLLLCLFFIKRSRQLSDERKWKTTEILLDGSGCSILSVITGAIGVAALLISVCHIPTIILWATNPEAWALDYVLNLLGGL